MSSDRYQELQTNMQEIQNRITAIAKTATAERRDYTQAEREQLANYFEDLQRMTEEELTLYKSINDSVAEQSQYMVDTFSGTADEYEIMSQNLLKTAQDAKNQTIATAQERYTTLIALLKKEFGENATLENEEYKRRLEGYMKDRDDAIQYANDKYGQVSQITADGYAKLTNADKTFAENTAQIENQIEEKSQEHAKTMDKINNDEYDSTVAWAKKSTADEMLQWKERTNNTNWFLDQNKDHLQDIIYENSKYQQEISNIWNKGYENMNDSEKKQVGVFLAYVGQADMYGKQVSDKTREMYRNIINNLDKIPPESKNIMKNSMQGMLDGMQEQEPSLFAKAANIASSVLSELRRVFDIHSPSRAMRKIFNQVMDGGIEGIEDEQKAMEKAVQDVANNVTDTFGSVKAFDMNYNLSGELSKAGGLGGNITLQFYPQEMTEAELDKAFNYVNRRFGVAY